MPGRSSVIGRSAALAAIALGIVVAGAGAVWLDLDAAGRSALAGTMTAPRLGLLVLCVVALVGVLATLAYRTLSSASAMGFRIAEGVRVVAHGNTAHRVAIEGDEALQGIARAVNALADERERLVTGAAAAAVESNRRVEAERQRLAALVAELEQSVLVCNRDGRILLYNTAARALLGPDAPGDELLGLGRSVFGLIDRGLVQHALEGMAQRHARDERPGTHFVTATADGRLLRVRVAPVTGEEGEGAGGYVLLLSDVTDAVDADAKRGALVQGLVEHTRASLANIRAAVETLVEYPELETARRARFTSIIESEALRLSGRLQAATAELSERLRLRWPLEDMRGQDLVTLAQRRIERRTNLSTKVESVDPGLWLKVDSFSLAQGLCCIAQRLKAECAVPEIRFRLVPAAGHAQLDLAWHGAPLSTETAHAWQNDPFTTGGEESPLSLTQVIERHGGEVWYQSDPPAQSAYFRCLLPLAAGDAAAPRERRASRPEFYDFDLFRRDAATDALDAQPLAALAYTVFDTETTGLEPAGGDEIIAIGAVRIVNGRLLQGETFETLVDPQRSLPAESSAIHGITAEMLAGQPPIGAVLPRFRRFAEDSVLVGHNAAFDLRFLQLKEPQSGVRFDMPVLDTLLLSAVASPGETTHGLDDIAARLGVPVVGRHTALGDARVTGEVFLRLLPLLAGRGVRTLGEARAAAERTYYARLKY